MQKAVRPQRTTFRDNYLAVFLAAIIMACSFNGHAQVFQKNTGYGTEYRGLVADSVLYFPTGCGTPSGIASLNSYGFGNGEKKRMSAIFSDTCGHHLYWFDWTDTSWRQIDGGTGGGGSSFSLRNITSTNFSTATNCPLPALDGDSLQIFWNDLNRFLIEGTEWVNLAGGGFQILVPGFDATSNNYSFNLYASSNTITPGPILITSFSFSTSVNCPLPNYNGMQLQIFWNDLNRYLVEGADWSPLAGGGFTITIPGFDASTTNYNFYIFNQ